MKTNQVCFRTLAFDEPWRYDHYLSLGGYTSWQRVLDGELSREQIIATVKDSTLRGRGGAGFPTGLKWSFMPNPPTDTHYLVCNSDESEPGTCKDRDIIRFNPHALVEGLALGAFAIGAEVAYNYLRGEFMDEVYRNFQTALEEAYAHNWLGKNLGKAGINIDIHGVLGAGAYICGEETALLDSLEGKKGLPRFKPPFPAQFGLYGKPTTVNNTESIASVPVILQKGPEWFNKLGIKGAGGQKVFSVSGHVCKPGNYEVDLGTPFADLLEMAGGLRPNRTLKAVIPGGSSVPVVPGEIMLKTRMDYDSIAKAGSMLGSGAVIVMDDTTDMVRVLQRIARFYYAESCGQCTPCREGTGWLYRMLTRIIEGGGMNEDLQKLDQVANNIAGHTICALGDAAAMPIISFIEHYREEFFHYIDRRKDSMQQSTGSYT